MIWGYADLIHKFNKMSRSFSASRASANFGAREHSLEVYQRARPRAPTHLFFFSIQRANSLHCPAGIAGIRVHLHSSSPVTPQKSARRSFAPFLPLFPRVYAARRQRCVAPRSLIKSGRRYFTLKKYKKIDKWAKLILGMKLAGRVRGLLEMMNEVELPYTGARPLG